MPVMTRPRPALTFTRLPDIAPEAILAHMSHPVTARHMPLLKGGWTLDTVTDFIAAKEACWQRDGLGHWAILADGAYAGWGGFQKEGEEWDFGLVLTPERFGLGMAVTRQALEFARADARIAYVTFLLPPSRRNLRPLERLGARYVGRVDHDGCEFLKYRLETG
jgi:RimJ/RimL family protein N-acetyltransferase